MLHDEHAEGGARQGRVSALDDVRRVALTGGIATGKSHVPRRVRARSASPTIDADVLAREAVAPGTPALAAVADAVRSRRVLDATARSTGDSWPRSSSRDRSRPSRSRSDRSPEVYAPDPTTGSMHSPRGTRFAVADIPLLFETGHEHDFDRVIVDGVRSGRLSSDASWRRDSSPRRKLASALPRNCRSTEKVRRADHVITTDGSIRRHERSGPSRVYGLEQRRSADADVPQRVDASEVTTRSAQRPSVSFAGAMRSSTNVFHSWHCGHCQSSSVLR